MNVDFTGGVTRLKEVALRYGHTDLNSNDILGGVQGDATVGSNWYLNPVSRIMFNYVWTDINKAGMGGGILHVFEVRFQVDF